MSAPAQPFPGVIYSYPRKNTKVTSQTLVQVVKFNKNKLVICWLLQPQFQESTSSRIAFLLGDVFDFSNGKDKVMMWHVTNTTPPVSSWLQSYWQVLADNKMADLCITACHYNWLRVACHCALCLSVGKNIIRAVWRSDFSPGASSLHSTSANAAAQCYSATVEIHQLMEQLSATYGNYFRKSVEVRL